MCLTPPLPSGNGIRVLFIILILMCLAPSAIRSGEIPVPAPSVRLVFPPSGPFTILQFTDIQDGDPVDPRTLRFMCLALEEVDPGLVVLTGDIMDGRCRTAGQVWNNIQQVTSPMVTRKIPWILTMGNHDEDHSEMTGMYAADIMSICISLPFNMNRLAPPGVRGNGICTIPVYGSNGDRPRAMIWCLDSGRYAPQEPLPVPPGRKPDYAWIGTDQVNWYRTTSLLLEKRWGEKIPGVMFFHIPLHEFDEMWSQREIWPVEGEKNEEVSAGYLKSGLFQAVLEREDVRGIFAGHDHVNDFHGIYHGILLAYGASAGYGTYGLDRGNPHRLRGARIIRLYPDRNREDREEVPDTEMIYAGEPGVH